ncbi:MAG TPA: hypothetical protein VF520_13600 [Thermoleophilaceae bacterium]|jgi:hypothetical protein
MRLARLRSVSIACAVAALAVAGCGSEDENEPKREGLGVEVAGLKYRVFMTRQLNQHDAEDRAYYRGPEPRPGFTHYGVFLKVCNESEDFRLPVSEFRVVDSQGNEFEPLESPDDNPFAYRPRRLSPEACVPEGGSVAATGPTGGALLVFDFPVQTIENRPLELEIGAGGDEGKRIELDL